MKKSNPDRKKIHLQRSTEQKLSKIKARELTFWRNLEAELKSKGNPLNTSTSFGELTTLKLEEEPTRTKSRVDPKNPSSGSRVQEESH